MIQFFRNNAEASALINTTQTQWAMLTETLCNYNITLYKCISCHFTLQTAHRYAALSMHISPYVNEYHLLCHLRLGLRVLPEDLRALPEDAAVLRFKPCKPVRLL